MSLIKKVQNTCFQNSLFEKGDKIILAISGGPDSTCLLDIFAKLQKKYDLELIIAHVNYGLRGKDSACDEEFVRRLAEKYKLEIFVLRPDAKTRGNAPLGRRKLPSEDALRKIRYDFFGHIRKQKKFDLVAVAHNADDQVETFLMRVIRGAGLGGLRAMRPKNGRTVRPLLDIGRTEIVSYLREHKLAYRTDKSNLESRYLRNKIRNMLIPYLEKKFNPNIKRTILGSIASIEDDYDFISSAAGRITKKSSELGAKKILKLHPSIQKRVLMSAVANARKSTTDIDAAHIKEIIKALKSTKSKRQTVVFKGLKMTRKGDKLELEKI